MPEFAFLRLRDDAFAIGAGPFTGLPDPPDDSAFYVNGFGLEDPYPWKRPAQVWIAPGLESLAGEGSAPRLSAWSGPDPAVFGAIFARWKVLLELEHLLKVVPVLPEMCRLTEGEPRAWTRLLSVATLPLWAYGWFGGEGGFLGLTPERFLQWEDGLLTTAALAGTSRPGKEEQFLNDPKQVREHELVVDDLCSVLAQTGAVQRSPRRILHLQGLIHYLSEIRVPVRNPLDLNEVIQNMHPTPAMGVLPRRSAFLDLLMEDRRKTGTPPAFGAPFGFWDGARFHSVIAIRGVFWEDDRLLLPSGCGLVRESRLESEWEELALKRHVVKAMLHLT
ncbi:MAG TPA: chorismate-binding protein [Verrucomicrobiales bacterium]|nr:chorismate-binding protein [Verrucomicrobiales bacterium]